MRKNSFYYGLRRWYGRILGTLLLAVISTAAIGQDWAQATVRNINLEQKKITLQHGEIKSLSMPPMRMVFNLEAAQLAEGLKVGDEIEFQVVERSGSYWVTQVRRR